MAERVAILGAGAMGSAPAVDAGNEVRLWGTWLDDELVAAVRAGAPHPRTSVVVDARVQAFACDELEPALRDAAIVVLAITSDGVLDVLERAAPHLPAGASVVITTKGFGRDDGGRVGVIPPRLEAAVPGVAPVVAIGGPCKANEVAARRPTASVYGCRDRAAATRAAAVFSTPLYRVEVSDDVVGLEAVAAMKNVYAIALGACQGLASPRGGEPWHNLQSAVFARAVAEMAVVAEAVGGQRDTAYGLAGVGDLEVTGLSGRNKVYGERLGRGEAPADALREMRDAGQVVEGVPVAGLARELAAQLADDGRLQTEELPLLYAVLDLIGPGADLVDRLSAACLPRAV
jgi:glycerol-3-phosphate dehydrogenase (NAD(P)+)